MGDAGPVPVAFTASRQVARNTVWNLLGLGLPLLVALIATPVLIAGLGTERFGILALAWVLIGYFSIFDLGIGRALTQLIAHRLGLDAAADLSAVLWTALALTLVLGMVGALLVYLLSPVLFHVLRGPSSLRAEALTSFRVLAISIPVVISSVALRGTLEARQRFGLVNAVRIPLGSSQYLAPVIVLSFSRSLVAIVASLVAIRVAGWAVQFVQCLAVYPSMRRRLVLDLPIVPALLRFGGWVTISNLISPLMVYSDRFIIGVFVSVAAVAYYATPSELITRVMLIPVALTSTLFPAFAGTYAVRPGEAIRFFRSGVKFVFLALFPIVACAIALASPGLHRWLGPSFDINSTLVLQLLAVGVLFNSLAQMPFAFIQAVGRPHLTATLHLLEAPIYFVSIFFLIRFYGIGGAAFGWACRAGLDCLVLFLLARRAIHMHGLRSLPIPIIAGAALSLAAVFILAGSWLGRLAGLSAAGLFLVIAWSVLLSGKERADLNGFLRRPFSFLAPVRS